MATGALEVGAAGCAVLRVVALGDVALGDGEVVAALASAGTVAAVEPSVVCTVPLVG